MTTKEITIPKEKEQEFMSQILLLHAQELKKVFKFGKLTILINGYHGPECDHNALLTEDSPEGIRACADIFEKELEDLKGDVN
jgi:hypothetical protein